MQKLLKEYLEELNKKQKKNRKAAIAALLLVVMVVGSVAGILSQYGVAMTGNAKCGLEEHQHTGGCYTKKLVCELEESEGHAHTEACFYPEELICGLEEGEEHTHTAECYQRPEGYACGLEESKGHTHTDACYAEELTCGKEEHIHTDACYIDQTADVEAQAAWDSQYAAVEWKNIWGEDLVTAARMQLGYHESLNNYTIAENGNHKGYTRYGQFAGDVYADWDAAFVNFCLYYAGLSGSGLFPSEVLTAKWYEEFLKIGGGAAAAYLTAPEGYTPAAGDLIFFVKENDETDRQMGIVSAYDETKNEIKVIEGNSGNEVKENVYVLGDTQIFAYLKTTEMEAAYKAAGAQPGVLEVPAENDQAGTEAPAIPAEDNQTETEDPAEDAETPAEETVFAEHLEYEDEKITITVGAKEAGIIPQGADLKVTPIVADNDDTAEQYKDVEEKLLEKAEGEAYEIAGFLAYDISFVDQDGNKVEPNGEVKVVMDYKEAAVPEELADLSTETFGLDTEAQSGEAAPVQEAPAQEVPTEEIPSDITVMHLEEDESGEVAQVVDLAAEGNVENLEATENKEIQKAEFVTESFSTFVITWTTSSYGSSRTANVTVHYVDESGVPLNGVQSVKVTGQANNSTSANANIEAVQLKDYTGIITPGYTFKEIRVDGLTGAQISQLRWQYGNRYFRIQRDSGSWSGGNWTASGSNWNNWLQIPDPSFWESASTVTGNVYIIYRKDSSSGSAGSSLGAPAHGKYIRHNEGTNDYTLTLDVAGKRGMASGIDVLFVIDKSGSMSDDDLMGTLQETVEAVIPTIVPQGTVNKVAAISFSSNSYTDSDIKTTWEGHSGEETHPVAEAVNGLEANGGTNWQYAMREAENKLSEVASDGNQKIVIFMSDGDPGYYFSTSASTGSERGSGNSFNSNAFTAAVNEVNRSQNLKKAKIYSVYLTNDASEKMGNFATELKNKKIDATAVNGTNLSTSLTNLINSVIAPAYTEVIIEDTLSTFVDFSNEEPTVGSFTVRYKTTDPDTKRVTAEGILDPAKYDLTYPADGNAKKFSLKITDGSAENGVLDPNTVYSISYNIKTTEEAQRKYIKNDYEYEKDSTGAVITGDAGTDAPGNATSSGEKGFRSNDSASVKYKENGDAEQKTSAYAHPVVQVNVERPIESYMEYDKTATVEDWDARTYNIKITAASKMTTTETEEKKVADIMMVFDTSGSMNWGTSSDSSSRADFEYVGQFSQVKSTLDTTKVYYYGSTTHTVNGNTTAGASYPMIYRDGKWKYYNKTQWVEIEDSSRTSIYTWPSRITALKEAASTFVTSVSAASPESKIGVVTYNANNNAKTVSALAAIGSNPVSLTDKIYQIYAGGGTYADDGLALAQSALNSKTEGVPQYIIFFADGTASDKSDASKRAKALRDAGVIIYTIGFGLDEDGETWLRDNIASPNCALTASNTTELDAIFKTIQSSITQYPEIKHAMIKDVIDPRFVILDDAGEKIVVGKKYTEEQIEAGVKLENGGTVYLDKDGKQFIVWNEQTIPNINEGKSWVQLIKVQAKDDYIGGNAVTTNASDSVISAGSSSVELPKPTVNVKADLKVGNQSVTIFKGDSVPTEDAILNALFTDSQYKDVDAEGNYSAIGSESFELKWYEDEACTRPITTEEMANKKPDATTNFYLKVTYDTGVPTGDSNKNTTKAGTVYTAGTKQGERYLVEAVNSDPVKYPEKTYGVYEVEVISGAIHIIKKLEEAPETDQTFNFTVTPVLDAGSTETAAAPINVSVIVKAGEKQGELEISGRDALGNLSRGAYAVEEVKTSGYGVKEAKAETGKGATNCQYSEAADKKSVTFTFGNNLSGENVISDKYTHSGDGTLGVVSFTNEKVVDDWAVVKKSSTNNETGDSLYLSGAEFTLTSADTVTYYGKSGVNGTETATADPENGVIQWYRDEGFTESVPDGKLPAGTYTLQEITAPKGYVLSNEQWNIEISSGGALKTVTKAGGSTSSTGTDMTVGDKTIKCFCFDNQIIYSLPSTGGAGIFWYSIGGTLLMMAGALILYKNKRREVLGS